MTKNHYFWTWFRENLSQFDNARSQNLHAYINWLDWHLHYYAPGLQGAVILPRKEKASLKLILLSNEIPETITQAKTLLDSAPKLEGWDFSMSQGITSTESAFGFGGIIKDINLLPTAQFEPIGFDGTNKILLEINFKNQIVYLQNSALAQLHQLFHLQSAIAFQNPKELCLVQLANPARMDEPYWIKLYEYDYYLETYSR